MSEKNILKLLIYGQAFLLFVVLLLPSLIRWLAWPLGKALYALLAIVCVALGVALHQALLRLE